MEQVHPNMNVQASSATTRSGFDRQGSSVLEHRELLAVRASAEQRSRIRVIMKRARDAVRLHRNTVADLRRQLARILAASPVDAAAAARVRRKIVTQQHHCSWRVLEARARIAAVLMPDQRETLRGLDPVSHAEAQGGRFAAGG